MTPQERELISKLFERLAALENAPRDADAGAQRGARRALRQLTVLENDRTLVRSHDAEQDLHQGALAGAVLAKQADDRPGRNGQVDADIGVHGTVGLGDPAHLQQSRHDVPNSRRSVSA